MNIVTPARSGDHTAKRKENTKSMTIQTTTKGITVKTPAIRFARMLRDDSLRSLKFPHLRRRLMRASADALTIMSRLLEHHASGGLAHAPKYPQTSCADYQRASLHQRGQAFGQSRRLAASRRCLCPFPAR